MSYPIYNSGKGEERNTSITFNIRRDVVDMFPFLDFERQAAIHVLATITTLFLSLYDCGWPSCVSCVFSMIKKRDAYCFIRTKNLKSFMKGPFHTLFDGLIEYEW